MWLSFYLWWQHLTSLWYWFCFAWDWTNKRNSDNKCNKSDLASIIIMIMYIMRLLWFAIKWGEFGFILTVFFNLFGSRSLTAWPIITIKTYGKHLFYINSHLLLSISKKLTIYFIYSGKCRATFQSVSVLTKYRL